MGQHKGSVFTASSTAPAPLTGRELCAKCLEVSTEPAQRQAKPEQCAPLPQPAWILGLLLVVVRGILVKPMRIPGLVVGEQTPHVSVLQEEEQQFPS